MDLFSQAALVSFRQKSSIDTIKHLQSVHMLDNIVTNQLIGKTSLAIILILAVGVYKQMFGKSLTNAIIFSIIIMLFMNQERICQKLRKYIVKHVDIG